MRDGVMGEGRMDGLFWSRKLVALPALDELSYTFPLDLATRKLYLKITTLP